MRHYSSKDTYCMGNQMWEVKNDSLVNAFDDKFKVASYAGPVILSFPDEKCNVINWNQFWQSHVSVEIEGKSIFIADIHDWITAAERNEEMFKHLGIVFDNEYFSIMNLYREISGVACTIMQKHTGTTERSFKVKIII